MSSLASRPHPEVSCPHCGRLMEEGVASVSSSRSAAAILFDLFGYLLFRGADTAHLVFHRPRQAPVLVLRHIRSRRATRCGHCGTTTIWPAYT